MKKVYHRILSFFLFFVIIYFSIGFYIAYNILKIDHSCGEFEGFLPNTWSTKVQYPNIKNQKRIELRKKFNSKKYHLDTWENVTFSSRDSDITLSGWLFDYYPEKPIVIIVHGIFPGIKCLMIKKLRLKLNKECVTLILRKLL